MRKNSRWKYILVGFLFGLITFSVEAQTLYTVSFTMTDSDSLTWINAGCTTRLVNPPGFNGRPSIGNYQLQNSDINKTCNLDSKGNGTVQLYSNFDIKPAGTYYIITLNPLASTPSQSNQITLGRSNIDLSGAFSTQFKAIRFAATGSPVFGYGDVEVSNPLPGAIYYNVATSSFRGYSGSSWGDIGGGSSSDCNPSLSTFGVIAANGGATNCLSSSDVFVDSTFNGGEPLQIDAAGVGALYAQSNGSSQPAAEFNANSAPSGTPDVEMDSSGALFPEGSYIFDTTDGGNDNNIFAAMAYNPQDTVCSGGVSCTPGTGVSSCQLVNFDHAGLINWGQVIIVNLTSTGGTLCTLPLAIQSYEYIPSIVLFNENDSNVAPANLSGLTFTCTTSPDRCIIAVGSGGITATKTYTINYEFKH